MITTSRLSEKLEIQELVISASTYGEAVESWKTVRVIYGTQTIQKGKLIDGTFEQSAMDYLSFYCRYTPLLKKGVRIMYNGEPYKIFNTNTVTRNQATIIELITYL